MNTVLSTIIINYIDITANVIIGLCHINCVCVHCSGGVGHPTVRIVKILCDPHRVRGQGMVDEVGSRNRVNVRILYARNQFHLYFLLSCIINVIVIVDFRHCSTRSLGGIRHKRHRLIVFYRLHEILSHADRTAFVLKYLGSDTFADFVVIIIWFFVLCFIFLRL